LNSEQDYKACTSTKTEIGSKK